MDFLEYIFPYYQRRLSFLEGLNLEKLSSPERMQFLSEASSLKKFIFDNLEEGYEETYNLFISELNAVDRLEAFLATGLALTGGREEELFYLCRDRISNPKFSEGPYRVWELEQYVQALQGLTWADVDQQLLAEAGEKWLHKTEAVLKEMVKFTRWVLAKNPQGRFICLLRDALIPYLGLRILAPAQQAVPMLISRKFLARHGAIFYSAITPPIYSVISANPAADFGGLCQDYAQELGKNDDPALAGAKADVLDYLAQATSPGLAYSVIESGVQGSMPLLLTSLTPQVKDFWMYTTAPWLLEQYREIIFRPNYNFLREMETLVCQNNLFDFHAWENGQLYIKENQDALVRTLASYELVRFRELLG